jgi:nitrogen fixation protein NifU and related proteins
MTDELKDLYQEVVIEHSKHPRNFRPVDHPTHTAEGSNPLCGDQLTLSMKLADGVIEDIGFQGSGCAISRASASLMTAALKGKRQDEALALFDRVHLLLTDGPRAAGTSAEVGKLAALSGVAQFPMRVKCATLAWHTLRIALAGGARQGTTE